MTKNGTLTWRVGQLERQVCDMDEKMEKIMENHLPHLQREMETLKVRMTILTGFNVGAIITGVLIAKYL